jgi:hypothetical protein
MAKNYIDKGISIGLWTQEHVSRWFSKGKAFRTLRKTEAPVRPSTEWLHEDLGDDEGLDGNPTSLAKSLD